VLPIVRITKKKQKKLRKKPSDQVMATALDYRRTDWSGKPLGLRKKSPKRRAARIEIGHRYRIHKQNISHFHPTEYSTGELECVAKGRTCEAWTFVMRRNDVPKTAREMAMRELARRDAIRRK
jgi:hypothetical protein